MGARDPDVNKSICMHTIKLSAVECPEKNISPKSWTDAQKGRVRMLCRAISFLSPPRQLTAERDCKATGKKVKPEKCLKMTAVCHYNISNANCMSRA